MTQSPPLPRPIPRPQCACGEHAKPVSLQGPVPETERAVRAQLAQLRPVMTVPCPPVRFLCRPFAPG